MPADDERKIYSDFQMIKRDVHALMNDWFGNGKEGYKVEVIKMKEDLDNFKKMITAKLTANTAISLIVLAALIYNIFS